MKKRYTKKQITEAIKHWQNELKRLDEESTFDNSTMIDAISELVQTVKQTKKFNKSTEDTYENRVWNGEFNHIEKYLKTIEKNLRLLGGKNQDIEAEKEVYVNLVPIFRDTILSLLDIIRSNYGMGMSSWATKVYNKSCDKLHDRDRKGISRDKTIYKDDALVDND